MGWITVNDLLHYEPIHEKSANSWGDFLAGVEQNAAFLEKNVKEPAAAAWTGTAAELAKGKFNAKQAGLLQPTTNIKAIQKTLETFSGKMTTYSEKMKTAVKDAVGMVVSSDGTVKPATGSKATAAHCAKVQSTIQGILADATSLDQKTAQELLKYLPEPADFAAPPVSQPVTVQPWSATVTTEGSLWEIAEKEYGDGSKWELIYDANKAVIGSNPNLIYPGMKLTIPPLAGSAGTPGATAGTTIANPNASVKGGPAKSRSKSGTGTTTITGDPANSPYSEPVGPGTI